MSLSIPPGQRRARGDGLQPAQRVHLSPFHLTYLVTLILLKEHTSHGGTVESEEGRGGG